MNGNEVQDCKNCGAPVKFNVDEGCWLHITRVSAATLVFRQRQCHLFARPTTPIEGVDF